MTILQDIRNPSKKVRLIEDYVRGVLSLYDEEKVSFTKSFNNIIRALKNGELKETDVVLEDGRIRIVKNIDLSGGVIYFRRKCPGIEDSREISSNHHS